MAEALQHVLSSEDPIIISAEDLDRSSRAPRDRRRARAV